MELKDVILSTLAEMDNNTNTQTDTKVTSQEEIEETPQKQESVLQDDVASEHSEQLWLESVRERLLVLFEGFQSPNNVQIEAKVDLTLNFLEYLLANIDTRIEHIKGKVE
ncbi:MAG: hypothetical protein U9P71_01345 [Campylobacterota bacterium]|nr:hypothetical protein [Campylobacterota bacterium]